MAEVMVECQGMTATTGQQRGIRMAFPGSTCLVMSWHDRIRVKQVLINLLSNAIKNSSAVNGRG